MYKNGFLSQITIEVKDMKNIFKNIKNWNASLKLGSAIALGGVILVGSNLIYASNSSSTSDISGPSIVVPSSIVTPSISVVPPVDEKVEEIIRPYTVDCEVTHYFYDEKDDASIREKAIVSVPGANRTYMLSEGCDYTYSNNTFDVIAVVSGTITDKMTDKTYGNIVVLTHENGTKFIYSSLGDVVVNKGAIVSQGTKIATSGTSVYTDSIGNSLHFEIVKDDVNLNPEKLYSTSIENL